MKKLLSVMLKQYKTLLAGIVFMILFSVFSGLNLAAIQPVLDYVFASSEEKVVYNTPKSFYTATKHEVSYIIKNKAYKSQALLKQSLSNLLTKTNKKMLLKLIVTFIAISYILKNLFFFLNKLMFLKVSGNIMFYYRKQLFSKYLSLPLSWISDGKTGDAIVRISSDADIVNQDMVLAAFNTIRQFSTIAILCFIAAFINFKLFLFSIFVLPVFAALVNTVANKVKKYAKRQQRQSAVVLANIEESLNNIPVIKAFSNENYERKRFDSKIDKLMRFWQKGKVYSSLTSPIGEVNGSIIAAALLIVGGKMVLDPNNSFSLGSFIAFAGAMLSMMKPLKEISKGISQIKKSMVSLDRIYEIIEKPSNLLEDKNPVKSIHLKKAIKLQNVSLTYPNNKTALKNINLTINKGQTIAIVGGSGSGKTTLIHLLLRFYDVSNGKILIDQTNIKNLSFSALRKLFGTVTQESLLFSGTIKENISYSCDDVLNDEQIKKACDLAHASEFIEKLDNKYDYYLHAKGSNLSGGQKQRICIARALACEPDVIIFDEATSALDTESEQKVQQAIDEAKTNKTVIVIAHRLSTVLKADKILVLEQGEIAGFDRHENLIKTCPQWQKLYNLQYNNYKG